MHHILYAGKCDLVFITETWLTLYITSGLHDPQSNFTIIRKDGNNSRGGGVCAFVKNCYSVVPLTIPSKYDALEAIGFDLVNTNLLSDLSRFTVLLTPSTPGVIAYST